MCVIVDVHMAKGVLVNEDADLKHLTRAIFAGRLRLVYGGRLAREYSRVNAVAETVVTLDQARLANRLTDDVVDAEEARIKPQCCSNDEHIIALARVSGARLLCTRDRALQTDFADKTLIDKPRGKVFKDSSHRRLLRRPCRACTPR